MDWPAHSRLTRAMAPIFNPWWCAAADAGPTLASFTTRFDETGTRVPVPPLANNATTEWRSRTEVPRRSGSIPYSIPAICRAMCLAYIRAPSDE